MFVLGNPERRVSAFHTNPASLKRRSFQQSTLTPPNNSRISRICNTLCLLSPQDDNNDWIGQRLATADWLEVRLDSTLCAIHVLARFLIFDLTLPRKEIPGYEIVDVVAVLDTFSSAGTLAILWTLAGLVTGLFQDTSNSARLAMTTVLAAPIWIIAEQAFSTPLTVGAAGDMSLLQAMVLGSAGVFGTMLIGRTASRFLP